MIWVLSPIIKQFGAYGGHSFFYEILNSLNILVEIGFKVGKHNRVSVPMYSRPESFMASFFDDKSTLGAISRVV
jgi:hypothetical protein